MLVRRLDLVLSEKFSGVIISCLKIEIIDEKVEVSFKKWNRTSTFWLNISSYWHDMITSKRLSDRTKFRLWRTVLFYFKSNLVLLENDPINSVSCVLCTNMLLLNKLSTVNRFHFFVCLFDLWIEKPFIFCRCYFLLFDWQLFYFIIEVLS